MRSDHRHELKTNELADWIAHFPEWANKNRTSLVGGGRGDPGGPAGLFL